MKSDKIFFYTLGCSKNDVDSYHMSSFLEQKGMETVSDIDDADVVIINTCGFIHDAKIQSIEAIWEVVEAIGDDRKVKLIITGCLSQRYPKELMDEIDRINGILGTGNIHNIVEFIRRLEYEDKLIQIDNINGDIITPLEFSEIEGNTAYIKISEGCNNNCSYCIIPKLKGRQRSRTFEDIIREAKFLVSKGISEIIVIAQNTADYGTDLYGYPAFSELLAKLNDIANLKWIRIMYVYPEYLTDEIIDCFVNLEKLVHYVDMPIQHCNDKVLNAMNRKTDGNSIKKRIDEIREKVPDIVIRTTFIVGFPGETEETIKELEDFIKLVRFDKLGVFTYSPEEGTRGYDMEPKCSQEIMDSWKDRVMLLQQSISEEILSSKIGNVMECLVEEKVEESLYVGRSYMDAPDIDGLIYINTNEEIKIGEYISVLINDAVEYDLWGDVYNEFA
ncbi:MAG: 30S ribosomal protein S12 methylthiotransferase RimO [Tissierellia bacterium]|nr:30S ribosomal protein S12 methylthiotransferase RimO [Tissierellia bacterium]